MMYLRFSFLYAFNVEKSHKKRIEIRNKFVYLWHKVSVNAQTAVTKGLGLL